MVVSYSFPVTDTTVSVILGVWPVEQIEASDDAQTAIDYYSAQIIAQHETAKRTAAYKANKTVPDVPLDVHETYPLADYQKVAAVNVCLNEGYGLFMEQGTGKTASIIAALCNEAKKHTTGDNAKEVRKAEQDAAGYVKGVANAANEERERVIQAAIAAADAQRDNRLKACQAKHEREGLQFSYDGPATLAMDAARRAIHDLEVRLSKARAEIDTQEAASKHERVEAATQSANNVCSIAVATAKAEAAERVEAAKAEQRSGKKRPMYRALIVCPNSVRLNWQLEFAKFSTEPGHVTVIRGSKIQRVEQLLSAFKLAPEDAKYTAVIVSYDTYAVSWNNFRVIPWDIAVLDESHSIKSATTRRWKYIQRLRDLAEKRVILTGTPVPNTVADLWTQLEFIQPGGSGFRKLENFRRFFGKYVVDGNGYEKLVGCQNLPFLQDRLARSTFVVSKAEALPDLPEKLYDVVEVEMTALQAERYRTLRDRLALEIENDMQREKNRQLVVTNVLTKLLRLAQITSGFYTWDSDYTETGEIITEGRVERVKEDPKVEALVELLKGKSPNDKTIVWACWHSDIAAIMDALGQAGIRAVCYHGRMSYNAREESVRKYNEEPSVKVFVGNPAAGGMGLNLLGYPPGNGKEYTTNTTHVIYFSQNWSAVARSQSEDRPHRRGTRVNVRVTDLCVPGTIDEEIRARVLQKRMTALEIMDVRKILSRVLKG
jgi:hypothetical protein